MYKSIATCFAGIVGQERAKRICINIANAVANGGNIESVLFLGLAGLGKTKLAHALIEALNIAFAIRAKAKEGGIQSLFYASPQEFRLIGDEYSTLFNALETMRPLVLGIDEIQDFGQRKTVQTEKVYSFVKKALDLNGFDGGTKHVRFDTENVFEIQRNSFGVVMATNYPEKIPDAPAMRSRLLNIELELMTEEELTAVLLSMLESLKIRADEKTIGRIARCGRGTCRPLEKITNALETRILATNKATRTVNSDDAIHVMRDLQLFPRGLNTKEVSLLLSAREGAGYKTASLALMLGIEEKAVRSSVAFLQSCDFVGLRGSYVSTSAKGLRYLGDIEKDGFLAKGTVKTAIESANAK